MPGFVVDGNVERVIDEYFERFWRDDQDRRYLGRHVRADSDHWLGRLHRHNHSHAERNNQSKRRVDHLLLPVRHLDVARILDVLCRCWIGLHAHLGLRRGHGTQSEYVVSLSTRGHELGGHVDRR